MRSAVPGVEVHGDVHDLHRQVAACTCATGSSATVPGGSLDAATVDPDELAAAIADGLGREVRYRDVPRGGAARAAAAIAELL